MALATTAVARHRGGVPAAPSDAFFSALYDELHRLADSQRRKAGHDLSIGTTTLLHEAYLNLSSREGLEFPDRAHFLGYAARTMRSLVIDYARRGLAKKRGGGEFEITLTASREPAEAETNDDLQQLSLAIEELAQLEPELAQLVDLHFFCGYTFAEIGDMRNVSERTVQRDWRKARLLLQHAIADLG